MMSNFKKKTGDRKTGKHAYNPVNMAGKTINITEDNGCASPQSNDEYNPVNMKGKKVKPRAAIG